MKKIFLFILLTMAAQLLFAQSKPYPTPEFMNEVSFLNKENMTLLRLEKGSAKMESKTKMGGMGGGESGYLLEGRQSPVRLQGATNLSFVFYNGSSSTTSPQTDSIMRANGMDPSMNSQMASGMEMMNDPSRTTSLYSMSAEKGSRQVTIQAYGGMKLMGKSKKESTKYTLSIKKIKNGYYEMVVDKPLPRGEYAFVITSMSSMDGTYQLFAFGID